MLHSIFYFVLNMSITASMIVIVLLILRGVLRRLLLKSNVYILWGIVLFRMIVPLSLPSRFSLINLISGYITRTVALPKASPVMPGVSALNSVQAASEYFPLQYKSSTTEAMFKAFGWVWFLIAALFVMSSIVIYIFTVRHLKKAVLVSDDGLMDMLRERLNIKRKVLLYESGFAASPLVFGIIKPRIIIPKGIPEETIEFALLHELCHIKRYDNLIKIISVLAVCIHWFNPVAWLFLYISSQDMEFACDERVLKSLEGDKRKSYASALTLLAAKQRGVFASFGSTAVKRRIMNIVDYKRLSLIMLAVTSLICAAAIILLITNPVL